MPYLISSLQRGTRSGLPVQNFETAPSEQKSEEPGQSITRDSGFMSSEINKLFVELTVANLERSLDFYSRVLGFDCTFITARRDYAVLRLFENEIRLRQKPEPWLKEIFGELESPFGRGVNFRIELEDLKPLLQRLKRAEIQPIVEPREIEVFTGDTCSVTFAVDVKDPDGYVFFFRPEVTRSIAN